MTTYRQDEFLHETIKSPRILQHEAMLYANEHLEPIVIKRDRPLRIAFLGTHGIPANYGGFETFVEQISVRLAERGHHITVYNRTHHVKYDGADYKGVHLVALPTVQTKQLDTLAHTFFSIFHGFFRRFDVTYICGVGNAPLAFLPRLNGKPTLVNVDGADWQRDKWGRFGKWYLRMSERFATMFASEIIADSHVVERYYLNEYHTPSLYIPYGSEVPLLPPGETLERFGLKPFGYILWVGRLVPENNCHDVIEAYKRLGGPATGLQLCILGDSPYSNDYIRDLKANAGPGVVFTGYAFGEGYQELGANARIFAFASGVGGTHPALLEAMARGNCIIYNDMNANVETVSDAGLPYDGAGHADTLTEALRKVINNDLLIEDYRRKGAIRAATVYSWERITDQYEALFYKLARHRR